ncbi:uncharacterized protein LOC111136964 [Crassostrea virginica]
MSKKTIINDPIWGPIDLHPLCVRVINTPEFQRLRSIKQLGGCSYVYPGACHSRFEHSIGTSYLAGSLGRALQKKINEQIEEQANNLQEQQKLKKLKIIEKEILCLELGGLCHDLGHGPFSHLFDLMFYPRVKEKNDEWKHEDNSRKMIDRIFKKIEYDDYITSGDIEFIKDLIHKPSSGGNKKYKLQPEKKFFFEIIANDLNSIDVDKWDYFSRDCHMLGLHHNFQCERTIKLAKVVEHDGKWHISYPKSEWFNIFEMFYTRFTLHRRAYQHPVAKAVEIMITDALLKADKYLTFPPDSENGVCLSASVKKEHMNAYLRVTDEVLHQIRIIELPPLDEEDTEKKDLYDAKRILDRIDCRDLYRLVGENKITWRDQRERENRISLKEWIKSAAEKFQELLKHIEEDKPDEYLQSPEEWKKLAEKLQELLEQIEKDDVQSYSPEEEKEHLQSLKEMIKFVEKIQKLLEQIEKDDVQSYSEEKKKYLQSLKKWIEQLEPLQALLKLDNFQELLKQIEGDNKEEYLQSLEEWKKSAEHVQKLLKEIEEDKTEKCLQSLKKWNKSTENYQELLTKIEKTKEYLEALKEWKKLAEKLQELLKQIEKDDVQSYNPEKKKEYLQSLKKRIEQSEQFQALLKLDNFQELLKQIEEDKKEEYLQSLEEWKNSAENVQKLLKQIEEDEEKEYLQSLIEWKKSAENFQELLKQIEKKEKYLQSLKELKEQLEQFQSAEKSQELLKQIVEDKKEEYLQSLRKWIEPAENFQKLLKQIEEDKKKQYLQSLKKWMEASELQEFMEKNKSAKNPGYQTEIVTFNYGNKDESPLDNVKFYEKDKSAKLEENEISAMLPTKFEQVYIRLYWKGKKTEDPHKYVLEKFHEMEKEWAEFVPTKKHRIMTEC